MGLPIYDTLPFTYYFNVGDIKAHKNIENHQWLMLLAISLKIDMVTR